MRKRIFPATTKELVEAREGWLNLETLAQVEVSSEKSGHPIEEALLLPGRAGWEAFEPGEQTIRIRFDYPQLVRRIRLYFREEMRARTQEFTLGWSSNEDVPCQGIIRQQFNFSPPATVEEVEDYHVELKAVKTLELTIRPEIGGGPVCASMTRLQIA